MVHRHREQEQELGRTTATLATHPVVHIRDGSSDWAGEFLVVKKRGPRDYSLPPICTKKQTPLKRSVQFWLRSIPIYTSYKICQLHTRFLCKEAQERVWEHQHEWAAEKVYSLCSDLGGFFLKVAQLVGKPDLAPEAWVKRLVTLCDAAPATPVSVVKCVLQHELGFKFEDLFEEFHPIPVGSASVAQVHRARIKGVKEDVAVKVGLEFDFEREARSMDRIANSFSAYSEREPPPIKVPRSVRSLVTRRVLIMQFMEGIPILKLGEEMTRRGINTNGSMARLAKGFVTSL